MAPPAVMALLKKKKKDSLESKQPSCLCHAAHHWREAADLEDNADKHEASQACPGQCFEWCVHKQLIDMRDDEQLTPVRHPRVAQAHCASSCSCPLPAQDWQGSRAVHLSSAMQRLSCQGCRADHLLSVRPWIAGHRPKHLLATQAEVKTTFSAMTGSPPSALSLGRPQRVHTENVPAGHATKLLLVKMPKNLDTLAGYIL